MTYFDTSALIKRFVVERGSNFVDQLVLRETLIATSKIAYAEVYSGLTRRLRSGDLVVRDYKVAIEQFERDWQAYVRVEVHDGVLEFSRDLIRRYGLRALDAIHLASACDLRKAMNENVDFVAADKRLIEAAVAEGLRSMDAEEREGR